ncbi:UPF0149 family protein [Aliikangiella maris]|uniref:UPF0149 family protein n=2 Tax=Aliikangiella maris TaxID=3162458 RepID=A0ABV2BW51_9GAMM
MLEPDYEEIESILADEECETSATQIQAIFCGMFAGGYSPDATNWVKTLEDMTNQSHTFSSSALNALKQMFSWTAQMMLKHDELTPMLLPDDGYPPIDILEALTEWCQGFLLGFGLESSEQSIENDEVKESLIDLADISNLALEAKDDEETREALFTLIEHIKVATQIIHWEMVLKNQTQTIEPNTTLH